MLFWHTIILYIRPVVAKASTHVPRSKHTGTLLLPALGHTPVPGAITPRECVLVLYFPQLLEEYVFSSWQLFFITSKWAVDIGYRLEVLFDVDIVVR